MKKLFVVILINLFAFSFAFAGGTANEAKALVEKAITYVKANGNEKGFAEISNLKGKFVDRDLYVWVADMNSNAKCLAHGANEKLIGKDLIEFKDSDGKLFISEIVNVAKAKGTGWVDYKWTNPVSKKIELKSVYFEKVDNLVYACGFYKG
jgi:cytochrome c